MCSTFFLFFSMVMTYHGDGSGPGSGSGCRAEPVDACLREFIMLILYEVSLR